MTHEFCCEEEEMEFYTLIIRYTLHYGAFWKKIGRFPILQATFFDFGSILVYYGRIELAFLPLLATTWVIYGQSLEIYYVN